MSRICILSQYYPPEMGAPQARLSETASRLRGLGWDVEVLTAVPNYPAGAGFPGYPRWTACEEEIGQVRVIRVPVVPSPRGFVLRVVCYLSFVLSTLLMGRRRATRPDILYVESPPLFIVLAARVLKWVWGCRVVLNVSDLWPDSAIEMGIVSSGPLASAAAGLERWGYRGADGITGQSEEILRAIAERSPGTPTLLVTNGVDPARFPTRDPAASTTPRPVGGTPRVCFTYAGLLGHAQGLDQVLEAARLLPSDSPVEIRLVGDGPLRPELQRLVNLQELQRVHLLGPRPREDIPSLLAESDVALVTLGYELTGAVPSKIYEAMAAELPVLLMGAGEARRRIEEARCGVVVPPGDVHGLASAMHQLACLPQADLWAMGRAGRVAAETQYDRGKIVADLSAFLGHIDCGVTC